MADGSITFSTALDNKRLERELMKTKKEIEKLERVAVGQEVKKSPLIQQAQELEQRMRAAREEVQTYRADWVAGVAGADKNQSDAIMRKQQLEAAHAKIVAQIDKVDAKLQPAYEKLDAMKEKAGGIERELVNAAGGANRMGEAVDIAGAHMDKFVNRVKNLARRVLVFSVITMGLQQMRTWMGKVIKTNEEATSAMARLKGALLTLAQPLVSVLIPAFTMFVNILAQIASAAANIVSSLFGSTVEDSAQAAKNLYDEQEAIEGVGGAAKKARKSLASFDEINKLSDGSGEDKNGSSVAPDFTGVIGQRLGEIEAMVGGALLAVGAILAFSGVNIPLGISLMAAGALTLVAVARENWDAIYQAITGKLAPLFAYLSGSLLVLGAIIAFSGANLGLGIGMMVAGAIGLATIVSLNWSTIQTLLQGPIGAVTAIVSGALLAVGALIAFSGANIPLGIGLMVAGALGLAASIAANWTSLISVLQGPIGILTAVLSAALLVIGALLLFSGANIPLGLGLLIVGVIGIAAVATTNWDTAQQLLQGPLGAVAAILSTAFLALGAMLLFSGASIPMGLGLIVVGATGLATSVTANWGTIQTTLRGPIGVITALLSTALLVLGAILTFSGANLPLGIGLLVVGALGLTATVAANWDTITEMLGGTIATVTAIASTALLALGVILLFTGAGIPLGLGMIIAGGAGLAASIVPNWGAILEKLKEVFGTVADWWINEVVPFWKELGSGIIGGILDGLKNAWKALTSWVTNAVNWIKEAFGGATQSASSVTKTISGNGGTRSKSTYSVSNFTIPALAQGAVIPANREFLAVLGDQKSGTNIEAPVSEIEAAVARGIAAAGGAQSGQMEIRLIVSAKPGMAREMKFELDKENRRQGVRLVTGGAF